MKDAQGIAFVDSHTRRWQCTLSIGHEFSMWVKSNRELRAQRHYRTQLWFPWCAGPGIYGMKWTHLYLSAAIFSHTRMRESITESTRPLKGTSKTLLFLKQVNVWTLSFSFSLLLFICLIGWKNAISFPGVWFYLLYLSNINTALRPTRAAAGTPLWILFTLNFYITKCSHISQHSDQKSGDPEKMR